MKSQAPTSILVLEYDNIFNKFRVINRTEIESSEFTFDKAVKKIIDINTIYNPSYIYLDRGAGKLFAAYIVYGLRNICSMRN